MIMIANAMMAALLSSTAIGYADRYQAPMDTLLPTSESGSNLLFLPLIMVPGISTIPVASVLTPFDANTSDLVGPSSWSTNYGKTPEIIVSSNGVALDVLAQDYDAGTAWTSVLLHLHAERPKLISIGGDQYIVLWEEWLYTGSFSDTFNGVYGMVIDDEGNILQPATLITDEHHLHRGDDAFFLDNRAAWMTGNAAEQKLHIHFVDASLNYEMVTLE